MTATGSSPEPDDRLYRDARRLGISIVGRFAEEFSSRDRGDDESDGGTGTDEGSGFDALRRAQVRAERAVDDVLRALTDIYAEAAKEIARPAPQPPTGRIVVGCPVAGSATGPAWFHNVTSQPAPPIEVRVGTLQDDGGNWLDGTTTVDPSLIEELAGGESAEVTIGVTVSADARPGSYHGLVFAAGIDAAPLLLTVHVEP